MNTLTVTDMRAHPGDSAFLIDDGTTSIMYDSGFGFTGHRVAEKISEHLCDRTLDYIFLTHSHYDHALGSAHALKRWPDAKVVAGAYAAKIFAKPTAKAVMRDLDKKFATACGVDSYDDLTDDLKVDIPVNDKDRIRAGNLEFIALNLPGHTKCSVGYYEPSHKLLLGCESLGVFNGKDDVVPSYLVGYQLVIDSISRVEKLDIEQILVPHYGLLSREQTPFFLQKAKERAVSVAAEIVDMLKAGKSKQEITEAFKKMFYHDYIQTIYPIDAMELNTGIMIDLLQKEFNV